MIISLLLLLGAVEVWVLALHLEAATSGLDDVHVHDARLALLLGLADDLSPLDRIIDNTRGAIFLDLELALFDESLDLSEHGSGLLHLFRHGLMRLLQFVEPRHFSCYVDPLCFRRHFLFFNFLPRASALCRCLHQVGACAFGDANVVASLKGS